MRLEKRIDDLLLDDDLAVARLHVAEELVILEARCARQDVVGPLRALGEVGIHGHDEVERVGPVAGHIHVGQMLRHDVAAENGRMAVVLFVGHVVDAHLGCGGGPVFRHRPRAERRGVAVVGLAHVDAHARSRLAHVARDGHEHRSGVPGDVSVGHLVVAAPAERQRRGALGVLLGQACDALGGNARDLGRPINRVGLLAFHELIPHRDRVAAAHLGRAGNRRRGALGVVDRRAGYRIDDEIGILLGCLRLGGGCRIDRGDLLMIADEQPRLDVDEERHRRVLRHELLVGEIVVDDMRDHAQKQRRIGARLDGNPLIGLRGRRGIVRVDRHHVRAGFLGVEEREHVGQARLTVVRPHGEHELRALPVARLGGAHRVPRAEAHGRVEPVARAHVDTVETAGLRAQHGSQETEVGLGGGEHHDGVAAVGILRGLDKLGDLVERLVPADRLELTAPPLADALERRLHAALPVDVRDLRDALQANGLEVGVAHAVGLNFHHASVAHRARQRAHAPAVALVVGARYMLLGRGLGRSRRQPAVGSRHTRNTGEPRDTSRSAGGLQESATRQLPARA